MHFDSSELPLLYGRQSGDEVGKDFGSERLVDSSSLWLDLPVDRRQAITAYGGRKIALPPRREIPSNG